MRVVSGSILDIAVDIRVGSPTFGKHVAVRLDDKDKKQLFIPRGFAHGFVVLSDEAVFTYKVDNFYSPECDRGIVFDDLRIGIDWLLPKNELILSAKDVKQPSLKNAELFIYGADLYA